MSRQVTGLGVDGQYILMGVPWRLDRTLGLSNSSHNWDEAHLLVKANDDIQKKFPYYSDMIGTIRSFLNNVRFGKKYQHLLDVASKYPEEKFYKLQTMSTTRFSGYFCICLRAILEDLPVIVESLDERVLNDPKDEDAKMLLRRMANQNFMGLLSAMSDIYNQLGKLSGNLQRVNSFNWERREHVETTINVLQNMMNEINEDGGSKQLWKYSSKFWPKIRDNTIIRGLPYLEEEEPRRYRSRRHENIDEPEAEANSVLSKLIDKLKAFIPALVERIQVLSDPDKENDCEHTEKLTNLNKLKPLSDDFGPEAFSVRVLERTNLSESCRYVTNLEDVLDSSLQEQLEIFLKRLHPILQNSSSMNPRKVIKDYMTDPDLFFEYSRCCSLFGHLPLQKPD